MIPTSTKLKPVLKDPAFWMLLLISLPGLAVSFSTSIAAALAAIQGHNVTYDAQSAVVSLFGLPVVLYLGLGYQVARSGAAKGAGIQLAAMAEHQLATNPPAEEGLFEVDGSDAEGDRPMGATS